ncbi:hypothetical protein [Streptomyces sp. NPDC002088]|uniref:hypothetical protein n=1 Tax=Streptomyces sp. NPDC002088 TaxID=3154665 RepID=UPI0033286DEA
MEAADQVPLEDTERDEQQHPDRDRCRELGGERGTGLSVLGVERLVVGGHQLPCIRQKSVLEQVRGRPVVGRRGRLVAAAAVVLLPVAASLRTATAPDTTNRRASVRYRPAQGMPGGEAG